MQNSFDVPILLILFNRPDNAKQVLDKIRPIAPTNIYIAIDGPRSNNINDIDGVNKCKDLIAEIDWKCNIKTRFSNTNQGCGLGPANAITWLFEHEQKGIILEDDCVPSKAFFNYCKIMLEEYEHDHQVMHIAGSRWSEKFPIETSYFFSKISHIWGWATWRRAWAHYDFDMADWDLLEGKGIIQNHFNKKASDYWIRTLKSFKSERHKTTWDYQWQYTIFLKEGLTINPEQNLINNIGELGTHTNGSQRRNKHNRRISETYEVTSSPNEIAPLVDYDNYHTIEFFCWRPPILRRIQRKIEHILK